MSMSFKPSMIALLCGIGVVAVAGTVLVKNGYISWQQPKAAETQPETPPVAPAVKTFTQPQLDQLVAPIALYPDPVLAQILMASTYPSNVVQAVQWSRDNPKAHGDSAVKLVANQPWDPSVKSLVALPQLLALMGENPEWVQNLGDAFLAQPDDVMNTVQKLRQAAQKNGSLTSNAQQKVIVQPAKNAVNGHSTSKSTTVVESQPQTIIIQPTNPQVVYVPSYNPNVVYGTWATPAYPPVYLPPPPGEVFTNSLVSGIGFGIGVATTYALFSSLDWDDDHHDDDHHHDDHHDDGHHDDYHGGGNYHQGNNYVNNSHVNINVNNYNHITGGNIGGATQWQHNPAYRGGVPYHDPATSKKFISGATQANVGGSSAKKVDLSSLHTQDGNPPVLSGQTHSPASQNLKAIAQRDNLRGFDNGATRMTGTDEQRQNAAAVFNQQAQHNSLGGAAANQPDQRRRNAESVLHERAQSSTPARQSVHPSVNPSVNQHPVAARNSVEQRPAHNNQVGESHFSAAQNHSQQNGFQQYNNPQAVNQFNRQQHANLFSGNASSAPNWHQQQERGNQSRQRMSSAPTHHAPSRPLPEHNNLQLHRR